MIYARAAATVAFTVPGQLLVKAGMLQVGGLPAQMEAVPGFVLRALTSFKVAGELALAVLAPLAWVGTVSLSDIGFAYPFMALAIVLLLALL